MQLEAPANAGASFFSALSKGLRIALDQAFRIRNTPFRFHRIGAAEIHVYPFQATREIAKNPADASRLGQRVAGCIIQDGHQYRQ
jgi:hypothetical protein